jgi:hypothetical protein
MIRFAYKAVRFSAKRRTDIAPSSHLIEFSQDAGKAEGCAPTTLAGLILRSRVFVRAFSERGNAGFFTDICVCDRSTTEALFLARKYVPWETRDTVSSSGRKSSPGAGLFAARGVGGVLVQTARGKSASGRGHFGEGW